MYSQNLRYFSFSLMKICENKFKIIDKSKAQNCFSNISARKYPSEMVQLSKWFLGCQVSNETKPKLCIFFSILEKSNKTMAQCFKLFLKNCIILFCLISPEMSHLKPDIERYILSTESFFRNICGLRYLTNNSELLINHQFSVYFHLLLKT